MRIGRSATRFFGLLIVPAVSAAAILYFGYYAVWGTRGLLALADVKAQLGVQEGRLTAISRQRSGLEKRIRLLQSGSEDPDLIEEVARSQMLGSTPGQIAVPRPRH
ncbi:MAG TPA: septum formation initiator family protein [Rhizomicrobium sp.]|jgi:cell division protein FtsB